jgi:hypothetical protein
MEQAMGRTVKGGLLQLANAKQEGSVGEIKIAMLEKTLPYVDKAGMAGVQVLCLQEVFNTPYFCPAQTPNWYDAAEPVPGPTTELFSEYARRHGMVIVVPLFEREMAGVYYNTAAVIDADGKYLGKYRKNHIRRLTAFGRSTTSSLATSVIQPSKLVTPMSACTSATTGTFLRERACWRSTAPKSCSILPRRWRASHSTSGSWNSPRTP